jgi:hypothetical protein
MSTPLPNTSELSQPTDGGDVDSWGLLLNALAAGWDRFLGGAVNHDMSAGNWVLTNDETQNGRMWLTGNSPVARNVVLPTGKYRTWVVLNLVQGAGTFMQINQGSTAINIPQDTIAVVMSVPGTLMFASPPVQFQTGGFPAQLVQPGYGYAGPGMFFANREVGLGSPAPGFMNIFLAAANANAELRFQYLNSAANPMIAAMRPGPVWDTGLYFPGGGEVHISAISQHVARFTVNGVSVGGVNGPAGAGTVNANQFFRNGLALPFQFPVYISDLGMGAFNSVPHGIGGPPNGVFGKLRCIQGNVGYNPGDIVDAAVSEGLAYGADAAEAFWCATGGVTLPRKGTGVTEAIDKSRWRLDMILSWP